MRPLTRISGVVTCTLKNGIVYVPIIVKTEAGFYMDQEPVAVVPAANTDALACVP
jgi:hypothetical protein